MGKIEIKLLSDSCISSGEVYNSSIDSDVCYDTFGLPFIPAKRIRGCLREAALELRDFGMKIDVEKLFGKEGNSRAVFTLSSAKLKNYESCVRQLQSCSTNEFKHQQTVLDQFTYVRYQTKIEKESGTAEDTSLRAIRVMKKGLEFVADMEIPQEYEDSVRLCCQNFRSMGMNRTRGMGEVQVKYSSENRERPQPRHESWVDGIAYERLDYQIKLKAPMLIKSVAGGQTRTIQYIDGAKILGMLAQNLGGPEFIELQGRGRLICANAYISDGKTRYTPVSASLYGVKNEKASVRDRAYPNAVSMGQEKGEQLVQIDGNFLDSDTAMEIKLLTVDTEIRYHHSRPQDKSVGHVKAQGKSGESAADNSSDSLENGVFYQMESIAEGQIFSGYILGTTEQLKKVYDILTTMPVQHLGYGKTSEYGEAEFTVTALSEQESTTQELDTFVIKLNSPAILYNENAMYAADEKLLLSYIAAVIKEKSDLSELPELKIENRFLKYTTIGGYNTTWGLHKPVINTFDAGTTLVLKTDKQVDIGRMKNVFLGERISEGYGEAVFYSVPIAYQKCFEEPGTVEESEEVEEKSGLIKEIAVKLAYAHIKKQARNDADAIYDNNNMSQRMNTVVANLLMMCRQQESFEKFQENIEDRFGKDTEQKKAKYEDARKIIPKNLRMEEDVIKKLPGIFQDAVLEPDKVYKTYVITLLTTLKYKMREEMG